MKIQNILVPVDFSPGSDAAVTYASSLAKDSDAELHFLHVNERVVTYVDGFGGYPTHADVEPFKELLEQVRPTTPGVQSRHCFKEGNPTEDIVEYAKKNDVDLIVMGTHGRTGLDRLLMGSVVEAVMRRAPCPVLTVKQPAESLQSK